MFCRNCGHTLRASGEPCLNCGTPSGFGYARHSYTSAQMPFIPFDADPDALFSRTRYRPSDGIYAPQKSQTPPAIMNMPAPLAQYSFESEPIRRAVKKDAEWGMAKETEPEEKWADAPAEPEKEAMLGEVWHENGFAMVGMLSRKAKRSLVKGDKKGTRQLNPITLVAIFAIVALVCIAAFSLISGRLNANEFTRTRENMTRTLRAFDETAYRDAFVSEYQINPRQAIVNFDSKGSFEAFTRSYTSDLRLMTLQNAASGIRAAIKNTLINQAEAAKGEIGRAHV